MNKVKIDYINFDPNLHKGFNLIRYCNVYIKDGIINLYLEGIKIFDEIIDDVGYDNFGKHLLVSTGEWRNSQTGKSISQEEFFDLEEYEVYDYEYVSVEIKIYVKEEYRACYHNNCNKKVTISFIPYNKLNFTEHNSEKNIFAYKGF